jgi:gamma-glutamylcyclotransferase (GGCT)/AIG2-like uncharacterized protein YtfP
MHEDFKLMSDEELEAHFGEIAPHTIKVFVYGSLKRGFDKHGMLEGSKYVGTTETVFPNFKMYPLLGSFPAVIPCNDDGFAIVGELYEVNLQTLNALDKFAGDGVLYTRRLTSVYNQNGGFIEAWIYLMSEDDKLIVNNIEDRKDQYVYTDVKHNTHEWFKD